MSEHSSHDLAEEFPEHADHIRSLVLVDASFSQAVVEYGDINREILRIEHGIENPADDYVETLKKKRLHLLDRIRSKLRKLEHTGA